MVAGTTGGRFDDSTGPARSLVAVTPHATNPIAGRPRSIYVGTGGDLNVRGFDDSADVILKNVPSGTILPIRVTHIRAASTTATDIVAWY